MQPGLFTKLTSEQQKQVDADFIDFVKGEKPTKEEIVDGIGFLERIIENLKKYSDSLDS